MITTRQFPQHYLQQILSTLDQWKSFIESNQNFSFIKFGDGEFLCMMGEQGANCDMHPYSKHLGDRLIAAWNFFSTTTIPNIYIAEWADQPGSYKTPQNVEPAQDTSNPVFQFVDKLLSQRESHNFKLVNFEILLQNTLSENKYNLFKAIKDSRRKKIFIGPQRLQQVNSFLNTDVFIQVPTHNSYSVYEQNLNACKQLLADDTICLFSSGMPTKAFISDLLKCKTNITCLDVGSGFDAIFVGNTREGQNSMSVVQDFYRELL